MPCPEEGALSTTRGTSVILDSWILRVISARVTIPVRSAPRRPPAAPITAGNREWPRSYG
ncbi:hypothetical protein TPA0908_23740 [Micromonospora sp. AKA38]|nr:hypothetical protein TPA0908_23740 [Micromonospora sp. AKA38]